MMGVIDADIFVYPDGLAGAIFNKALSVIMNRKLHRMKPDHMNIRRRIAGLRSAAVGLFLLVASLLPVTAFAHEGGKKGPWIDFSQYGFDGITQMMNAHPAFVHFPIALLPAILVFYCLGTWLKWPSLLIAGRATLYLAFLSLIIVVYTGLSARSAPSNEAIEAIMQTHKNTGFVIMGIVTLLVLWSFWTVNEPPVAATGPLRFSHKPVGNWAYLLVVALATYLVLQNADLGGKMVYMHGAAVKPMVPLIQASKPESGAAPRPTATP